MIKNEDYSLLNRRISNSDMERFCLIFEEKSIPYTCEVYVQNGPRYTYKYIKSTKEPNPFKEDSFKNKDIKMIRFKSKYCKLQYGEDSENKIMFEGDENDESYQYFFTRIDTWSNSLVKLNRLKLISATEYILYIFYSMCLVVGLTVGYGFLSDFVSKSRISTVLSSVFLGIGLLVSVFWYMGAFPPYEIKIGLCKYKKYQAGLYSLFSLCIIPLVIGLVV